MYFLRLYLKLMDKVNQVLFWIVGILLGAVFVLLVSQVYFRYVMNSSLSWSEEAARYLTIWIVFLGVALGLRRKRLIAVEVVVQFVPKKLEFAFRMLVLLVSLVLMAFLFYFGIRMGITVSNKTSTAMGIPMWIPYAAIPIGTLLTLLNAIAAMIEMFTEKEASAT
ncbi:MAG TPA: TRAP transporter small permease [Paenibacillaceae bacterium]